MKATSTRSIHDMREVATAGFGRERNVPDINVREALAERGREMRKGLKRHVLPVGRRANHFLEHRTDVCPDVDTIRVAWQRADQRGKASVVAQVPPGLVTAERGVKPAQLGFQPQCARTSEHEVSEGHRREGSGGELATRGVGRPAELAEQAALSCALGSGWI